MRIRTATSRVLPGKRAQRELQDVTCAQTYIHAMTRPGGPSGFGRAVLEQLATTPIGAEDVMYLPRDVRHDLLMVLPMTAHGASLRCCRSGSPTVRAAAPAALSSSGSADIPYSWQWKLADGSSAPFPGQSWRRQDDSTGLFLGDA